MLLKKILFFKLFLVLSLGIGFSQNSALLKINQEDLKRHLTFIASDSLQGRQFGTSIDGLEITANYLAEEAKKMGLKPGSENYFQNLELESSRPDIENTFLKVIGRNDKILFNSVDVFSLIRGSEFRDLQGEIVYAGFGWQDKKTGYNDFEGLDLEGKIVMYSAGKPEDYRTDNLSQFDYRLEISKMEKAVKAGARGVILVNNPLEENNISYNRYSRWLNRAGYRFPKKKEDVEPVKFVFTKTDFADMVLGGKGRFEKYLSKSSKKNKPNSFLVKGVEVHASVVKKHNKVTGKNIVAVVEGSDPVLKNECVTIMAHYDHLGVGKDGNVYNGADDNGSGTVTLLEVAEAFMSLKQKPKRSVVFLWVTAEEIGLLGSDYYCQNPVFALDKTVASINIDMNGRVYEPRDSVWNDSPKLVKDFDGLYTLSNNVWPELKDINNKICDELGLVPDNTLPARFLRSSDHYHFHKNRVPILNYATGYHADYHKVGDEVSKINFDKMKRVADLVFLVSYEIANKTEIEFSDMQ